MATSAYIYIVVLVIFTTSENSSTSQVNCVVTVQVNESLFAETADYKYL